MWDPAPYTKVGGASPPCTSCNWQADLPTLYRTNGASSFSRLLCHGLGETGEADVDRYPRTKKNL